MKDFLKNVRPVNYVQGAVYAALFLGIYHSTFSWLILKDWSRDDYSASMLIPFIVVYLIWDKQERLSRVKTSPSWAGIWVVATGVLIYWIGELAGEFFSLYLSSWLILMGLCWLHLGRKKLKIILFPIILLLAMFPLPNFIHGKLSFKLKLISSQLGVEMMQWMGMSAYREGNVIDLGFTKLQVVDACSGLRYLIPLIILSVLVAYFSKCRIWKKVLLVLSSIPISVLVNSLRIASVGILYPFWGQKVAEGFFHDFSGWLIFMVSLGVLLMERWLLNRLIPEKVNARSNGSTSAALSLESDHDKKRDSGAAEKFQWKQLVSPPHFVVAAMLLTATLVLSQGIEFREKVPAIKSVAAFPETIGAWHGIPQEMEQKFLVELDLSEYALIDYRRGDGKSVNFYLAWYESQRKGESIHSPSTCLPGGGWLFKSAGQVSVPLHGLEGYQNITVNRAYMQKADYRQLSYYWFPARGRILTSTYQIKMYNFWDALTRQRTDGALVRLITPQYPGEGLAETEERLNEFTREIIPVLGTFLPR